MSEQLPLEPRVRVAVEPRTVTRAAAVYSSVLAFAGVAVLVALVARGASLPPFVPMALLVAVVAVCVGRVALYPSGLAATAELAVLLCAVTAFRTAAPVTGPLLLALLVGPLDRDHWRRRSYVRMAYNSGDRAAAALGAAGAFAGVTALLGTSVGAFAAATAVAAVAATVLDSAATVGLVVALGGNARAARREMLDVDALALPLAVAGGAVGFLAAGVGWWAAALPLGLLALVPELLQARARIPARFARDALVAGELVVALVALSLVSTPPTWPTVMVLVGLSVLVGVELVVDARVPVSPVLGIAVVLAGVSVHEGSAVFAGGLVAALATAMSWWSRKDANVLPTVAAVVLAAVAGVLVALVVRVEVEGSALRTVVGVGAAVTFGIVVSIAARGRHRVEVERVVWTLPMAAMVLGGPGLRLPGTTWVLVAGSTAVVVVAVLAAWCGSTPWRSRLVSRRLGLVHLGGRWPVGVALGVVGSVVAVVVAVRGASDSGWLEWLGLCAGEAAAVMGLFAVRQWRFVPQRRLRECAALIALSLLLAAVLVPPHLPR